LEKREVEVDYGNEKMLVSVPNSSMIPRGTNPQGLPDPRSAVQQALENPIGIKRISELAKSGDKVMIAFDHHKMHIPRTIILPLVFEELNKAGISKKDITLVSSPGACPKSTRSELREEVGGQIYDEFWPSRLRPHDAAGPDELVYLGESKYGDIVEPNRLVKDCDILIYLGAIRVGSWGGYSAPGAVVRLGSARSIRSHHSYGVMMHKDSIPSDPRKMLYKKHKTAIQMKIEETTGKQIFYVDSVYNRNGELVRVFAGHYPEIAEPEWKFADELYIVDVPRQADIMIIGLPRHVWYGNTNNVINALTVVDTPARLWINKPMLKEGGVIVVTAKVSDNIDRVAHPNYDEIMKLWDKSLTAEDLIDREEEYFHRSDLLAKYKFGYAFHPAHPFWLFYADQYILNHAGKIIFAGVEDPAPVRRLGCTPTRDFKEAWRLATQIVGNDPETLVLPDWHTGINFRMRVN